jgi:hypothetical protein
MRRAIDVGTETRLGLFDVIGGEILDRSAQLVRSGGALVTIAEPPPGAARRRTGGLLRC